MPLPDALQEWLSRELLERGGTDIGAGYQATVTLLESPWGKLVLKRAKRRSKWSQASIAREHEIYVRLQGIAGIPRTYGMFERTGLVLEYVEGEPLRKLADKLIDREAFFARLLETIDAMHAAGVAHCDLKRKDNTLVGPGETPYLVDFGVACILKNGDGRLKRWWFRLMRQMDFNAWVKLRYGRNPENLPDEVAVRYRPLLLERIARWIRIPWQKVTLRRLRKRIRNRRK